MQDDKHSHSFHMQISPPPGEKSCSHFHMQIPSTPGWKVLLSLSYANPLYPRVKSLALTFICKSPLPPVEKSCSHLNKSFCLFYFEIWMCCCLLINTVNLFDAADLPYLRTEIVGVNWLYNVLISKKQDFLKFSSSYNERCLRYVTSNNNIVDSGCGDAGPGNER